MCFFLSKTKAAAVCGASFHWMSADSTDVLCSRQQFYSVGFSNIPQQNVSPKSIIADNGKLYIGNERYMHTANGIKSSHCGNCYHESLTAPCVHPNELESRKQTLRSQLLFLFLTGLQLGCILMENTMCCTPE